MKAQPDINRSAEALSESSRGLDSASREIRNLTNLPSVDNGQSIQNTLDRLTTAIENLRANMNTRFDGMNTLFDGLELRLRADSYNQVARTYNSHISNSNTPLRILHNHLDIAVDGFPVDSAAVNRLQSPALTTLLGAFQLPSNGTLAAKRRRFREFVGLVVDV